MQVAEADSMETRQAAQSRFERLLEEHWRIVLKVTGIYAWNPEDARDLSQEISCQLWRAFPTYDNRRLFSTWMYRIALNVAISFARQSSYRDRHTVPIETT